MADVHCMGLTRTYGDIAAVRDLDLAVADHEFVVLVGPSGCGKSTTLRMVAGLEQITRGELRIGGNRANDLTPAERNVAMVFQNYALYPHLTVAQNIGFGLRRKRLSRPDRDRAVREAARMLEIEPLLDRKPGALSGGQKQRVAMGRAIVRDPAVFLFDEPLSNLDARLRLQMRAEIRRLHARVPTTTIYVTHDQTEAMTMADRVVVMNKGRIEQVGPPMEVYRHPRTRFVAEFIGSPGMNLFPADLNEAGTALRLADGTDLPLPEARQTLWRGHAGRPVILGLRPEDIAPGPDGAGPVVPVQLVEPLGVETLVHFDLGQTAACARLTAGPIPRPGERVTFRFDLARAILIDPATDAVIGAT
ncbi:MAG: sn-glycerol-3-phosphate ABC transporter ATP-binding protein UgpC [Rubellimicrobium sp.]|nr:sn-glycerol-3-phosphate ABC transporter ATP-binding protein UgpC [Rubellimicrobium sp.]